MLKRQTIAIHTPYVRPDAYGALAVPVYNNVAYEFGDAEEMSDAFCNRISAPDYARMENPTVTNFEQRVKALTGAAHVTAFNSGMAAISNALLAVSAQCRTIVTSRHLFGNTLSLISGTLLRFGVKSRLRDFTDLEAVEEAIDEKTCCVFLEIVTNPQQEVADLKAISEIAHRKGVPVIADSSTTRASWQASHSPTAASCASTARRSPICPARPATAACSRSRHPPELCPPARRPECSEPSPACLAPSRQPRH